MAILTQFEIDETCLEIIQYIKKNHSHYYPHIMMMYLYGCRIGEVFNNRIYFDAENDKITIAAQKGNNLRVNPRVTSEVPYLIERINLTQENFWINKRNLQRIISTASSYRNLYCGNKKIGAHLFRHNWVKKQVASGKQITEIDNMLGYTKQSIIDTYLPSTIRYNQ